MTATCIDDGSYDEVIYCTVCKTEISRETKIIESELVDHTPGEAVVENETSATCTDEGSYEEVIYCTKCNAEISRETKTIGKLSHSYVLIDAKSETCTQNGNEAYYICDTCKSIFNVDNEIIEDVPVIPALNHIDEDEDGICDRCKMVLSQAEEVETSETHTFTCPLCAVTTENVFGDSVLLAIHGVIHIIYAIINALKLAW